ncbi:hypothetical protein GC089_02995 [Cellulomonas sp. JZ18]|uniref:hypothetical protein n=1 Tax=Cellulomonas sp. JZ18 TaxID=2654191 RepID=UPI0012D428F5|nr:hypothetical protein [Cellulomonas sp. JZ18]QGQ18410.1 hypothetical protein GC089_02995 [Cellulomonas sp. JZ18]
MSARTRTVRRGAVAAVLALLAGLLAVPAAAAPAPAQPPAVVCDDSLDLVVHTVVPGDLRVEPGCDAVSRLTVLGDLHIGADVVTRVYFSRVLGDVHIGPRTRAELTLEIAGGVHLDRPRLVTLSGDVGRSVRGLAHDLLLHDVRVAGAVNVSTPGTDGAGFLTVRRAEVGGWLNRQGGHVLLHQAWLRRGVTVRWARSVVVSEVRAEDDVTVAGTGGSVHVGDLWYQPVEPHWDRTRTPARSTLLGDVLLERNRGLVVLGTTDVGGGVDCRANHRTAVLDDVSVAGARTGQCA